MRRRGGFRHVIAALLSLVPLAWLIVTALTVAPKLDSRMASHWSGTGTPDGFADTWPTFWMFAAIVAGLTAGSIALVVAARTTPQARLWVGIVVALSGLSALAWTASAEATAAAATPEEAVLGARLLLLIPVVGLAALAFVVTPPAEAQTGGEDDDEPRERPTPPLRSGDRLVWSGTTGSAWFGAPAAALIAGGILCLVAAITTPALIAAATFLLLLGCTLLLLASVRVVVDARGIRLVSTVFRIPLIRVKLDDIDAVTAEQISPLRWGGWGYRISTRGIAYVTRKSEGIVITRRRGADVAITIGDAEQASAAAELLVDQHRAGMRRAD